jgi:hypothetical protein
LKKGGGHRYFSHVVRNLGYRENSRQFAAAFGAYAERVEKPEEIRTAIKMAFAHMEKTKKPAILDIIVERETDSPWGQASTPHRSLKRNGKHRKNKGRPRVEARQAIVYRREDVSIFAMRRRLHYI